MASPGTSVLVVDDDPSIRFLCRVNLQLEGCDVHEARTLAEARERLGVVPVDVVLLDVHIGAESGVDFLHELRRDHPRTRVAMLTGSLGMPTLDGVTPDSVISKPFTLEQLIGTVGELAARR